MAKACVLVGWDDVPHLSAAQKESILSGIPAWQRDARTRGTPSLGAGAIYPIPEADIICAPFEIPSWWARGYGFDTGWNRTAGLWFATDPETGAVFAYSEYYRGQVEPAVHAEAVKKRGAWMTGVIDPASRGQRGLAGEKLLQVYRDLGMNLELADNALIAGLTRTWDWLSTGKLKIFSTLSNTRNELRLYRRNDKGEIIKENDHLMDALRYFVMSGLEHVKIPPKDSENGMPWFSWTPPDVWSG